MTDYVIYGGFVISHEIRICGINQSGVHGMSETHRAIGSVYGIFTYIVLILRMDAGFFGHTSRFPHIQVSFLYIHVSCLYTIYNNHYLHLSRAPRWKRAISRGGTLF